MSCSVCCLFFFFFFFQAEDGIRDYKVTGVQTCALPISVRQPLQRGPERPEEPRGDAFARQRFADPQAERERRFSREGAEALQRGERAAGRLLQGNGGEADRTASAAFPTRGRAPTRAHETPRARAERACEAALGLRGQAPRRRADCAL